MAKTCPTCGTLNPNEANVCFNCGTAIAPYSTAPDLNAPTVPQNPFQQPSYPAAPSYPQSYSNPQPPYAPPVAPPQPYQQSPYAYHNQFQGQQMMMMPMAAYPAVAKSRVAFILLGVFLGAFGVHNFYAGYVGRGITQLLLTLFTCGYAAIIVFIWSIVEIIVVDRDVKGVPMY